MRQNTFALFRFQQRFHDRKIRGTGEIKVSGVAVFDEGGKERRWILDFNNPGVLPVGIRHAGEKTEALSPGKLELGTKVRRLQRTADGKGPSTLPQEGKKEPHKDGR